MCVCVCVCVCEYFYFCSMMSKNLDVVVNKYYLILSLLILRHINNTCLTCFTCMYSVVVLPSGENFPMID